MPMDPKKIKQVLTNHFENLTQEKFLNTLRKSSPHLFIEDPEERDRVLAEIYSQPSCGPSYYNSDPWPVDVNQNGVADQNPGLPHENLDVNGSPDKLSVEINEDWLQKNATSELLLKIYEYLPDAERKRVTEALLNLITPQLA